MRNFIVYGIKREIKQIHSQVQSGQGLGKSENLL